MNEDTPATWTRRGVVLSIAAVVAAFALLVGIALPTTLYVKNRDNLGEKTDQVTELTSQLRESQAAEKSAYQAGYKAGRDAETQLNKTLGLTYPDGFNAGHRDVFAGFKGGWTDNTWYLVKVGHGAHGHDIKYRYDVTTCRYLYVDKNDDAYDGAYAC